MPDFAPTCCNSSTGWPGNELRRPLDALRRAGSILADTLMTNQAPGFDATRRVARPSNPGGYFVAELILVLYADGVALTKDVCPNNGKTQSAGRFRCGHDATLGFGLFISFGWMANSSINSSSSERTWGTKHIGNPGRIQSASGSGRSGIDFSRSGSSSGGRSPITGGRDRWLRSDLRWAGLPWRRRADRNRCLYRCRSASATKTRH
jgi:hypothetical protein